jgi:hypothetical protein
MQNHAPVMYFLTFGLVTYLTMCIKGDGACIRPSLSEELMVRQRRKQLETRLIIFATRRRQLIDEQVQQLMKERVSSVL